MTLAGQGAVGYAGNELKCMKGDIVLISPEHERIFRSDGGWDIIWARFIMSPRIIDKFIWPENIPGYHHVHLSGRNLRKVSSALLEIVQLDMQRHPGWHDLAMSLLENVIMRGNSLCSMTDAGTNPKMSMAQKLLSDPQSRLNIDALAGICGMSRASFYQKFKSATGISPCHYRELLVFRRAQQLLECTHMSIGEVAEQLHMPSIYYFSSRFRKFCGMSPSAYRRNIMDNRGDDPA